MKLIPVSGELKSVELSDFEAVCAAVGGHVEILNMAGDVLFCVDEDGGTKRLPVNGKASLAYGGPLVGTVVVLEGLNEIKRILN